MKTLFACFTLAILSLLMLSSAALGADTLSAPAAGAAAPPDWATVLITILTPLVIAGAKALVPRIPSWLIPIIAPLLGALLTVLANAVGLAPGNWMVGALLGLAGVGVREIVDQLKKANAQ